MNTITVIFETSSNRGFDWAELRGWGTLLAALFAGYIAYQAFRRERRRDKVAEEMRVREQASKCSAWLEPRGPMPGYSDTRMAVVKVRNASDLPIENVLVWLWSGEADGVSLPDAVTRPGDVCLLGVVAPGETAESKRSYDLNTMELNLSLTFSDAQGVFWLRHNGLLGPSVTDKQPNWFQAFEWEPPVYMREAFAYIGDFCRGFGRLFSEVLVSWGFKRKK